MGLTLVHGVGVSGVSHALHVCRLALPGTELSHLPSPPEAISGMEPHGGGSCYVTAFTGNWCLDFTEGVGVRQGGMWWLCVRGGW